MGFHQRQRYLRREVVRRGHRWHTGWTATNLDIGDHETSHLSMY